MSLQAVNPSHCGVFSQVEVLMQLLLLSKKKLSVSQRVAWHTGTSLLSLPTVCCCMRKRDYCQLQLTS